MKNTNTIRITQAAVIAALYAVLTIGQNLLLPGTASAAVQFRVAEVLCVLAIYTPVAIPGLTIGCVIANISSVTAGLGFYDMVFGSLASFAAAVTMYLLRNIRFKTIPIPALLMPALWNGVIVGFEIAFFFMGGFSLPVFFAQAGLVALGEFVVLFVLGIPFCKVVEKIGIFKRKQTS